MSLENRKIATGMDSWEWELSRLLEERMNYVSQVWLLNKQYGKESLDQAQWAKVESRIQQLALDKGMNHKYVKDVWNQIHSVSLAIEDTIKYEGGIIEDESKYDVNIEPLRKSISSLNDNILCSIQWIINIFGETNAHKKIESIIENLPVDDIVERNPMKIGYLSNFVIEHWEVKIFKFKWRKPRNPVKYILLDARKLEPETTIKIGESLYEKNYYKSHEPTDGKSSCLSHIIILDGKMYFKIKHQGYFDSEWNCIYKRNSSVIQNLIERVCKDNK